MIRRVLIRTLGGVVVAIIIFCAWYYIAADYSYNAVSGTYSFNSKEETSVLILNKDQSFHQELSRAGTTEHAQGSWRRIGEGGVVFLKEFLKISGEEVRPDGQADGEVRKRFGLFQSIALNPDPGGPVFQKELTR